MKNRHLNRPFRAACPPPSFRSFVLGGALALGLAFLPGPAPLHADGEADEELVAHFDEHLEDFAKEVEGLADRVDAIVTVNATGGSIDEPLEALIEEWERVEIHEVIEAKAIHLYPPIWQGIYAIEQAGKKSDSAVDMARAAEKTKSALWQSLGGLRALAALPGKGAHDHDDHAGHDHDEREGEGAGHGIESVDNEIELTGDDNMRFDETRFVVAAGEPVTLRFKNIGELPVDVMGHNVVVLDRGTPVEPFGLAAAEASENDYIPTEAEHAEDIVAHTAMLGPGEEETITFTLEEPGEYPFICSFVAHWRLMQGTIEAVVDPGEDPVGAILQQLEKAVRSYADGDAERASSLVHAAYMNIFEGLEGDLIEQDPDLVSQLELDFNAALPATFEEDGSPEKAREMLETMRGRLLRAKELLSESKADRPDVF